MSAALVPLSREEFTRTGRRLMGSLWENSQDAYESHWLGEASPQRSRGAIDLLGWKSAEGGLLGRIALWRPKTGDPCFFLYARDPSLPEAEAVRFVAAVRAHARELGIGKLIGPIAFSTWHPYRFISRRGEAPFFPGEQRLAEQDARDFLAAGFRSVAEYQSTWVPDLAESIRTGLAMGVDRALGKVRVEALGKERLPELLPELHRLSCAIFRDNFGYTPLDLSDFLSLASGGKDGKGGKEGESALIMASVGDRPAGFVYSYAIGPYAPAPGAPAAEACVLKTLGVHPDFRSIGLGYGLSYLTHKHWLERGRTAIIHAYMKTDNHSRSMSSHFGEALRDYVLVGDGSGE